MTDLSVRNRTKPSDKTTSLASETVRRGYVITPRIGRQAVRTVVLQKQEQAE